MNADTGQTVLSGMGELHLEIVHDRLRRDFGVDCSLGKLQVAYKEQPTLAVSHKGTNPTLVVSHKGTNPLKGVCPILMVSHKGMCPILCHKVQWVSM